MERKSSLRCISLEAFNLVSILFIKISWWADFVKYVMFVYTYVFCIFQGASPSNNIDAWKWKFTMLLRDKEKQELVSREKRDRHDFEQLSALASGMGLYRYHLLHLNRCFNQHIGC